MRYRPVPGGPRVAWLGLVPLVGWGAGAWWLWRMTAELVLEDDVLRARGMAHERRVPPADVTAVRPMGFAPNMVVIDVRHRCPILTVATKGLCRFTAEMERRRPGLPVRFGWPARLGEQLPGRSRTTGD